MPFDDLVGARRGFIDGIEAARSDVLRAVKLVASAFSDGRTLFICGNGGSAADAQHMAAEFVGRFGKERSGLPAIALTTDTSALTAIANDWDYAYVFRRQLEALGLRGDVIIGISTSGASKNVLEAFAHARSVGISTIGIVGVRDCELAQLSDVLISVSASKEFTPIVQEKQLAIEHMICELVEDELRVAGVV
jgi:D-sedoheptulose 7-phosphate isomerase